MTLTLEELAIVDGPRLFSSLEAYDTADTFVVRISTDMLCNQRPYADMAFDWLAVLMLGETLVKLGGNPIWTPVGSPQRILAVDFTFGKRIDRPAFDALLGYAASYLSFYTDGRYPQSSGQTPMFDYEQELLSFEDDIQNRVHHFNDIAEMYTSNFVAGLRQTYMGADYVSMLGRHQLRLKKWLDVSALRCSA